MQKNVSLIFSATLLLLVTACGKPDASSESGKTEAPMSAPSESVDYDAIVKSADRSDEDKERDASRKPAEALAFFQIKSGQTVFEVEAGGGYFTELYSRTVGPQGAVVMQNFQGFLEFANDEITARLADNRLANVRQSISLHDDLDAEDNSVDVVTWVQGPHELYYVPEEGVDLGDPAGSFAEIFRILKPGGVFSVIDHAAADGAPTSVGNDLHRVDKAHVIDLAKGAGFVLEAESDFLANPDDDHTALAFASTIRGKTDQFALRFKKPE